MQLLNVSYVLTRVYPILCPQGGQAWHGLCGEVPHCMQHICGVDAVVICRERNKKIIHTSGPQKNTVMKLQLVL